MIFKREKRENRMTNNGEISVEKAHERFYVALFYSTSLAIRGEKLAKNAGLEVKLIPTPRHLSSDCGTAMRFFEKDRDVVEKTFDEAELEYNEICPL